MVRAKAFSGTASVRLEHEMDQFLQYAADKATARRGVPRRDSRETRARLVAAANRAARPIRSRETLSRVRRAGEPLARLSRAILSCRRRASRPQADIEEIVKAAGLSLDYVKAHGIEREQMRELLERFGVLSETEVVEFIETADANGDGVIDIKEFDAFVESMRRACHGRGGDPNDPASWCPHAL
jgi:hypothetical protein